MDGMIQSVASGEVPVPTGGEGVIFWVMVGVVLAIQIADKIIYWMRNRRNGNGGSPDLALQIQKLNLCLENATKSFEQHSKMDHEAHVAIDKRFENMMAYNNKHFDQIYDRLLDIQKNKMDKAG